MYFYLSWLRPPPVSSPVNEHVTLTPQVANDLRTELFEEELRISYQWLPVAAATAALPQQALPLTTWHGSGSAYKTLAIDPPRDVRAGETWSLALFGSALTTHQAGKMFASRWKTDLLDLVQVADVASDWVPIPVKSEPIRFTAAKTGSAPTVKAKGKGKAPSADKVEKQDRIQRTFVLPAVGGGLDEDRPELQLTEQTSFDLDKKIWDSGLAVAAFLAYRLRRIGLLPPTPTFSHEGEARLSPLLALLADRSERRALRILELGTGSGLVSIALACLLKRVDSAEKHQVYATDLPSALPLVARNVEVNQALFAASTDVHGRALDWESEELPPWVWSETGDAPRPYDLVCLVDVTYNVAIFPALLRTLLALLRPPTDVPPLEEGRETLVLLAWKERDPTGAEKELWRLAAEAGISLELVGSDAAHGGMPVEFWVGRLVR